MRTALRLSVFSLLPLLAIAGAASSARADESAALRFPVSKAERPLTLPGLVLKPEVGFELAHRPDTGNFTDLSLGAAFGVTDNLTVRVLVLPLQLSGPPGTGVQYGQTNEDRGPGAGLTYRFVRGPVEVGGAFDARIFTVPGLSGAALVPSVPVRIHAGDDIRIDVVPAVNFTFATVTTTSNSAVLTAPGTVGVSPASQSASANAVRIDVPVRALANMTDAIDVGVNSGLTIYDVSRANDSTGIPLGVFAGYAIAGASGPIVDIDPFFNFPYFVLPGRKDANGANQYQVGVSVSGYLYW